MDLSILELIKDSRREVIEDLAEEASETISRFPGLFDKRLLKGLARLFANSSSEFLSSRSYFHLKKILLAQFSLQIKMEQSLLSEHHKPLLLKLFRFPPSRICIAFSTLTSRGVQKEQVLKSFQILLPSVQEVPGSFYTWHHPDSGYHFSYFEVQKLRGKDPSSYELRELEQKLLSQLLAISPLTPALFWPYNKEESFRQIQLLQREMKSPNDLPHISVHFQEQTLSSLEFLIHVVRPAGVLPLDSQLKQLPNTFSFFSQHYRSNKIPFPIEIGAFSIQIPPFTFEVRESINLLYARRYVLKHLEIAIGPFRDINGGLFEIQQQHFEAIRSNLSDKIPHFELFAEKVFYALHPVETWLSLPLADAEAFFLAFSSLLDDPSNFGSRIKKGSFSILKMTGERINRSYSEIKEKISHAQISLGEAHFICLIGPGSDRTDLFLKERISTKTLRLFFQEGAPPSLNPHYSSGDLRCRIVNKLLFEGLTRLNEKKEPELAGAEEYHRSSDGLTYTFKLRPSNWSNGEKVTASDYVSSWKGSLADSIYHPEHLFILKGAHEFRDHGKGLNLRSLDSSTLQVELEKPDPHFLYKLAQPYFFPLFGSMREPKWFNGPYLIRDFNKERLLLDKNAYFWDASRTYFEQIEFRWSEESVFPLFEKREIDWIGDPLTILCTQQIGRLQEEKKLEAKTVRRRFSIYYNTRHPILKSPLIRRALSLSIDRPYVCGAIYPGSVPLKPLIPEKEEAQALFEKGLKELGINRENFPVLTFRYSHQARREKLAIYLQAAWRDVLGISVYTEGEKWNDFRNRLEERAFEICCTIQDTLLEGTLEYYERFGEGNSWNFSQWSQARYQALLEQVKKDPTLLPRIAEEFEKILKDESPFSPLFNYTHLYARNQSLEGFWIDDEGCIDFSRSFFNNRLNG